MTLRDVLPHGFFNGEFEDSRANKFLDVEVLECVTDRPFPQKKYIYRNIYNWFKLANGYAVAWNESPRNGWSFPVVRISQK